MEFAQKLISTRRGSFYTAIVAALIGAALILVYLNRYRQNVNAGSTPVTVLVARQTIPKGTPGDVVAAKTLFSATTIRESQLRDGAFSDPASLTGKVATTDIYGGSQLTAADFAGTTTSPASTLTDHQRIISIPLDAAHGVSGELQTGDHVDIYAGFNVIPLQPDGAPANGGTARAMLREIMRDIDVVAITGGGTGVGATKNVSLRVNDQQAADLAFASDNGKIWLALRPSTGAKSSAPSIVSVETLLLGVPPVTIIHSLGGHK